MDADLSLSYCDPSNQSTAVEIGAEVFAAELIYPEADFAHDLENMGISMGGCNPEAMLIACRDLLDLNPPPRSAP